MKGASMPRSPMIVVWSAEYSTTLSLPASSMPALIMPRSMPALMMPYAIKAGSRVQALKA
jgi:hypothetical protein